MAESNPTYSPGLEGVIAGVSGLSKIDTERNVLTYRGYNVELARVSPDRGVLPSTIYIVAWSHNGKRIAAVGDEYCGDDCGVIVFWDAATGRNISFYLDLPVFALAWSPDDTRVVTAVGTSSVEIHRAK